MTETAPTAGRNRRILFIMLGLLVFVLVASTALYRAAATGMIDLPGLMGTRNHGVLVQPPLAIAELGASTETGARLDYSGMEPKWTLLVSVREGCDERCREALYQTRQVRLALGRDLNRVRRFLLGGEAGFGAGEREWLREEHDDLIVLRAESEAHRVLQEAVAASVERPSYYIVDPRGWVMMSYGQGQNPKDLLADLKFLLKYSGEQQSE